MNARAAQARCQFERLLETLAALGLATGQDGDATLARLPVTGGAVEEHLLQTMPGQLPGHCLHVVGGGKEPLDPREPIFGRHPALLHDINRALAAARADGTWQAIHDRWLA